MDIIWHHIGTVRDIQRGWLSNFTLYKQSHKEQNCCPVMYDNIIIICSLISSYNHNNNHNHILSEPISCNIKKWWWWSIIDMRRLNICVIRGSRNPQYIHYHPSIQIITMVLHRPWRSKNISTFHSIVLFTTTRALIANQINSVTMKKWPHSANDIDDSFSFTHHGTIEAVDNLLIWWVPVDIKDNDGNCILAVASQNGNKRL